MADKKVWFVTGCSKGMGNVLARKLLAEGYRVAATSRTVDSLVDSLGPESDAFLPLAMDVTDGADVARAVAEAEAKFGRVDVLVNNAGYTHLATIEEFSDADARAVFDVNVFGTLNCIRAALPGMRERGSGHIFDVSSLGAYNVGPLSGVFYAASVHGHLFAGKPAAAVATLWRAGSTSALDELARYFTFSGMPVASSTYWNLMLNSGDDAFGEDVLRQLGQNMAALVKATS